MIDHPADAPGTRGSPARKSARAAWPAAGLVALVFAATLVTRSDPDLWGHVRFGLDILETWQLPADDPYSFTQDKPWVNHEWLAELTMGAAYATGGAAGLALLKGALVSATLFVMWTAFRRARLVVQLGALVLLAAGSLHVTSPLRPQLWTFLCLAVLCRLLLGGPGARRWIPAVFIVWANAHGGWVVGSGVLLAWAAAEWWSTPSERRAWVAVIAASLAGTLVTPHGWRLWEFVATTVRPGREIEEWLPLWASEPMMWIAWVLGALVTVLALARPGPHRLPRSLVLGLLAYGALTVMRIGPFFLEAALVFGSVTAVTRWPATRSVAASPSSAVERAAGALLVAVPGALAAWLATFAFGCIPQVPRLAVEPLPVRALAQATGGGRLVIYFDWGQYAIWHLGPRLRVSTDGRRETIYSDRRLDEHAAVVAGEAEGIAALAEWNAEYVWLPASSVAAREWLVAHGYRVDLETTRSFVAVRSDLPPLPEPEQGADRAQCFPN